MDSKRLFVAINFPAEVRDTLMGCIDSLKGQALRGYYTKEENLHLTVVFIGETSREKDIIRIIKELQYPAFSLSLNKIGKFAHSRGDVYWAGLAHSAPLFALHSAITSKLIGEGFNLEQRTFTPHITLGRKVVARNPKVEIPKTTFEVPQIQLMQSQNENGKLQYITLYTHQFIT